MKGPPARGAPSDVLQTRLQLDIYVREMREAILRERSATDQLDAARRQLEVFADDIRKLFEQERERRRQLESAYRETLLRLARAAAYRDEETATHCDRLGHYSRYLCQALRVPADESEHIAIAAPLHDLGKIGVPDSVLLKRGPLHEPEWRVMRTHPGIGASLLRGSQSELIETARLVALTHHECWDGSGYPEGLTGTDIPHCGRIVKMVDVYDALRTRRPYKTALPHDEACRRILEGDDRIRPSHFDPDVLQAFRSVAEQLAAVYARFGDDD